MNTNFEEYQNYLSTNKYTGLTSAEVEIRQKKFGLNNVKQNKKKSFIKLFFEQLFEYMSLLLLISGIIAIILSSYELINIKEMKFYGELPGIIILNFFQGGVLLLIVFINAFFGAAREKKSLNSVDALQKLSTIKAKVIRDNKTILVDYWDLTIGDIFIVESGDIIPADGRVIESSNLKVIEAILTGESTTIEKSACTSNLFEFNNKPIGDRTNDIFMNTNVVNGRALAIVNKIGIETEIGKIAEILNKNQKSLTPLQLKLNKLSKTIGLFGIILTFITFIFSLLVLENVWAFGFSAFFPSILLAISIATSAIPEGLNAVVNIVLSIGINKMAKKNGLIKKLTAVETLGSTSVICSDKTGTLTMNKMTVVKMWHPECKDDNVSKMDKLSEKQIELLKYSSLCTDCVVNINKDKTEKIGDPTEIAIVDLALKHGFSKKDWDEEYKRVADIPFDSDRKLMTSINKIKNDNVVIVKGAPDVLLRKCKNSKAVKEAHKFIEKWSSHAIRVLAVAIKKIKTIPNKIVASKIENDLEFVGLIGMIDPPREEVKDAIKECMCAGIKPVMITGDHLNTAIAIAKDLNIYSENDWAITGEELDKLSDDFLNQNIEKYSVYARVSPENKIRIVKAWQFRNQVVSMTGDGVNDAPALQAADIGCAMGITGTDVSKDAADMILVDDNFATIVESVKQGRIIYENIRRIILFLLSSNFASIIAIALGIIIMYFIFSPKYGAWGCVANDDLIKFGISETKLIGIINENIKFKSTLSVIYILINNIIVETVPGISLGIQDINANLMSKRPRSKFESVFADGLIKKIFIAGLLIGILSLVSYIIGAYIAIAINAPGLRFFYGSVSCFIVLSLSGIVKSIWLSTTNLFFKSKWNDIKIVYYSCLFSLSIILFVVLVPQIASLFSERPHINNFIVEYNNEDITNILSANEEKINKLLFNNENENSMINGYIWVSSILIAFVELMIFESWKLVSNKLSKNKDIDSDSIKEFKMIEKPVYWYEKNKLFSKLNNILK